ncbi:amidase domain-containing protein [Amnibacterium endophyticum]|uniref:Amidase domain-containing protein n=1 Tax=Amnibacterium endophyticum TaxID=2109337 RepID=A0ABW4LCK7_9MICO
MGDRSTTLSALAATIVAGAVLCGGLPAQAVTPTPAPSTAPTTAPTASTAPTTAAPAPATSTPAAVTGSAAPTAPRATTAPTTTPSRITLPPRPATPTPSATPTPTPTPIVPPPVATRLSSTGGHASGSRTLTLTGSRLQNLTMVQVAGQPVTNLVILSPTSARFRLQNAIDYQAQVAPISLTSVDGITRPTSLTFTYRVTNRVDRQMAYAFQNWNSTSNSTFGYLSNSDCANFASQTLLARGWKRGPDWYNSGPGRWSATWVSSTALSSWLKTRPDLATRLPYRQRDQVRVGDIVQFRWPGHKKGYSAWDHTGIVSKVVVLPNGRHDVYYTSHTLNRQYGGSTQLFARVMAKDLRIQFFRLLK